MFRMIYLCIGSEYFWNFLCQNFIKIYCKSPQIAQFKKYFSWNMLRISLTSRHATTRPNSKKSSAPPPPSTSKSFIPPCHFSLLRRIMHIYTLHYTPSTTTLFTPHSTVLGTAHRTTTPQPCSHKSIRTQNNVHHTTPLHTTK